MIPLSVVASRNLNMRAEVLGEKQGDSAVLSLLLFALWTALGCKDWEFMAAHT